MSKRLILTIALVMGAAYMSASAGNNVTIKGHVQFTNPDFKVSVYQYEGSGRKVYAETTVDADNNYQITMDVEKPGAYNVDCGRWQDVRAWLEDENLEINFRGLDTARIKIKNPPYVYINGGQKNEVMNILNYASFRNYQMMIAISQTTYRNIEVDSVKNKTAMDMYEANGNEFTAWAEYLVRHYGDRTSILAVLPSLPDDKYSDLKQATLDHLLELYPNYQPVTDYIAKTQQDKVNRERMADGNKMPLFSCPDQSGKKKLGPADYKGKILVVDFWASWCGPCRQEIPNVKKYYEEFHDKGVEVLSVSIDAKEADWRKALKEENMPWSQVLAPNGGKEVMDLCQFSGIPYIVLIDREGNIVAKNLRGEDLEKAIAAEIDKKPGTAKKSKSISMMGF
jgi:thiol-disulfide isomerase/thioredoxin